MQGTGALIVLGGMVLLLFLLATALSRSGSLNGIKAKTVGDGQHGTARWATKREILRAYRFVPFTPNIWRAQAKNGEVPTAGKKPLPQGIVVGCRGRTRTTALVDTGDVHPIFIWTGRASGEVQRS